MAHPKFVPFFHIEHGVIYVDLSHQNVIYYALMAHETFTSVILKLINFPDGEISWKLFHQVYEKDSAIPANLKKA